MFKGTKLEIGFIRKPKSAGELDKASEVSDITPLIRETAEVVTKAAVITFGSYILLDTLRQVIVKLTPEN